MKKIRFDTIHVDYVTMSDALNIIEQRVLNKHGGFVVTPNVDHVVLAKKHRELRSAYQNAMLSLADGMPLVWMSSFLRDPLPEKISGSDMMFPLFELSARQNFRVYLLGAAPGVAERAAEIAKAKFTGLNIVGVDSPPPGFEENPHQESLTIEKMKRTRPDLLFVALGCPKQEILMNRWSKITKMPVMMGVGASFDFIARNIRRAPKVVSRIGLEWAFRITQDPVRLTKRYLIRDMAIVPVFLRMLRSNPIYYDSGSAYQ